MLFMLSIPNISLLFIYWFLIVRAGAIDSHLVGADSCQRDSDCQNNGQCMLAGRLGQYNYCKCTGDYGGTLCERFCPLKCQNHGACRPKINENDPHASEEFECACRGQWTGDLCNIPFQICPDRSMCLHGGTCEVDDDFMHSYKCKCPTGFHGETCTLNPNGFTVFEKDVENILDGPVEVFVAVMGAIFGISCAVVGMHNYAKNLRYRRTARINEETWAFDHDSNTSMHMQDIELI